MMNVTVIALLEIATGVGLILFWVAYFTVGLAPKNPPVGYHEFERSFPFPDGVLAIGLLIAGIGLLRESSYAGSLSMACAGALIFLGLLDFSFGFQNTFRHLSTRELFFSIFINGWCVAFGTIVFWQLA